MTRYTILSTGVSIWGPPAYRKEVAEEGWKRMLAWFKKNGVA